MFGAKTDLDLREGSSLSRLLGVRDLLLAGDLEWRSLRLLGDLEYRPGGLLLLGDRLDLSNGDLCRLEGVLERRYRAGDLDLLYLELVSLLPGDLDLGI